VTGASRFLTGLVTCFATLVQAAATWLLELRGMGPFSTAQVLVSWSHTGRVRSEAAFAAPAGISPIPASYEQFTRHRLM
jgi:transposase